MTGVADTRILIAVEFPPSQAHKQRAIDFLEKEIGRRLLAPSVIFTEFIAVAGSRLGEDTAKTKMRLLKDKGLRTVALDEEEALVAGCLLLSHQNVPIADALIASFVKIGIAEYVVTDDQHFKSMGIKTKWF